MKKPNDSKITTVNDLLGLNEEYYSILIDKIMPGLMAFTSTEPNPGIIKEMEASYYRSIAKIIKDDYIVIGGDLKKNENTQEACINLVDLNLIDSNKATWEQIIELRKDVQCKIKLRNLRCFFEDSLIGKDKYYILDKIETLKHEYNQAAHKHGFKTITTTLSGIFARDALAVSLIGSYLTSNTGLNPIINLGVPITFMVADIVVNVFSAIHEQKKVEENNPAAYLFEVQKKIK
jgi:hypothetical protein